MQDDDVYCHNCASPCWSSASKVNRPKSSTLVRLFAYGGYDRSSLANYSYSIRASMKAPRPMNSVGAVMRTSIVKGLLV